MTYQYINPLPRDKSNTELQEFPAPVRALATSMRENAVASSALAINPNTTHLEVGAVGGHGVALRWVRVGEVPAASSVFNVSVISSGVGANFDHIVPAGTYRRLAVPKETGGIGPQGLAGAQIGSVYGLYQRLAVVNISTSASSVLFVEY